MINIVDYGIGNLKSILNILNHIGVESRISNSVQDIKNADKLILPGVGHFKTGMENLAKTELIDVLNEEVLIKKKNILGYILNVGAKKEHF